MYLIEWKCQLTTHPSRESGVCVMRGVRGPRLARSSLLPNVALAEHQGDADPYWMDLVLRWEVPWTLI